MSFRGCLYLIALTACSDSPAPSLEAGVDASANQCTIDGSAYPDGTANLESQCLVCDLTKSSIAWSPTHEGLSCGSQTICHDGKCTSGCFIDAVFTASGV